VGKVEIPPNVMLGPDPTACTSSRGKSARADDRTQALERCKTSKILPRRTRRTTEEKEIWRCALCLIELPREAPESSLLRGPPWFSVFSVVKPCLITSPTVVTRRPGRSTAFSRLFFVCFVPSW
jgi:hypothetical protein